MIQYSEEMKETAFKVLAEDCKSSLFRFVQVMWDIVIAENPSYNWHIPYLCSELQIIGQNVVNREVKPYDLIVNIPPGTTKSTIATVMFPAWLWAVDPSIRIITNSYSNSLSIEHATKSKDIITSEKYRTLFPDVIIRHDKSGKQHYESTKTGFRYATSTGSTITGYHGHIIISDDPVNPKQADSEVMRKGGNEHTKTLSSRKVDKANTPMVTIMQRLHEDDVTGYLLKKKGDNIKHVCLPAEDCDDVKPSELRGNYVNGLLDPVRLNRAVLDEAFIDLGSRAYTGQYGQSPTVQGGNIIKSEWFKKVSLLDFERMSNKSHFVFFADTAYTKKDENDPSGLLGACKIGNDLYIIKGVKVRKEFPDLVRFLPEWVKSSGYGKGSSVRIEPKANGLSVVQYLKENTSLNITTTPTPTDSKEVRLNAASPFVECGRVVLVDGSWNEEFVEEITGFPNKPHDEYVDLLCYAIGHFISNSKKPIDKNKLSRMI